MTASRRPRGSFMVIGVGNPGRGDDGAGPAVCDRLTSIDAVVVDDPIDLLAQWQPTDRVAVVDATAPAGCPGRVEVGLPDADARPPPVAASTHGIDVTTVIGIGRTLDRLPAELVVVGIEADRFDHGVPLSAPVEAAVARVVTAIEALSDLPRSSGLGDLLRARLAGR